MNLKELRKMLGLTQKELAKILNINQSSVSDIENNITSMNIEYLKIICEKFNISADEILGINKEKVHMILTNQEYENLKNIIDYLEKQIKKIDTQKYAIKTSNVNEENVVIGNNMSKKIKLEVIS